MKFTIGKEGAVSTKKHVAHTEFSADSCSLEILALCENKLAKYPFIQDCLPNETLNSEWNTSTSFQKKKK